MVKSTKKMLVASYRSKENAYRMPNVATTRTEYDALMPTWEVIRDCLAGEEKIKEGRTKYLPMPTPSDQSEENKERYRQYLERAVFYNVTGRTASGLQGQVYRKEPVYNLPPELDPLFDDVDGAGVGLIQQSFRTLGQVLAFGRSALWVDYPQVDGPVSRAAIRSGAIRPTIIRFDPWDVINWRTRKIGGEHRLSLVVIHELYVTDDDGFEEEFDDMWRVLKLDENNQYVVEEWINDKDTKQYQQRSSYAPRDANGNRLNHIPFTFVGSTNNDSTPDRPPLYDLARLNIAHYRNSADYEESCFIVGQPTPYLSGLTQEWVDDVLKGQVMLGSRAAIPLPENGTAGLLQVQPNSMPREAMNDKERQMIALGAKLVETAQTVARTATEVAIKDFGEHSVLTMVSRNVSEAYEEALWYAYQFIRVNPNVEVVFKLNRDFELSKLNANEIAQIIASWQAGAIVESEMRDNLRRGGIATLPDEEYHEQLESEDRSMLMGAIAGAMPPAGATSPAPAGANQNLLNQ